MATPRLIIDCASAHYQAIYFHGVDSLLEIGTYTAIVDTHDIEPLREGLGQVVSLTFIASDEFFRTLNTTLLQIEDTGLIGPNLATPYSLKRRYKLTLGPRLSLLDTTEHSRIFLDTSVENIIKTILASAGYGPDCITFHITKQLPPIHQCVQAMESNTAFFHRLLRQYGLFYWFKSIDHHAGIIITDTNLSSPYVPRGLIEVKSDAGMNSRVPA